MMKVVVMVADGQQQRSWVDGQEDGNAPWKHMERSLKLQKISSEREA
jgi:hypothetical protein